jgi:hypothetical protein
VLRRRAVDRLADPRIEPARDGLMALIVGPFLVGVVMAVVPGSALPSVYQRISHQ